MINETELNISNKSYTNKDFQKVYEELLDLVGKLTTMWDPTTSNESDPGVVLLKLMGFVSDKLNYNIDKNILECFLPSATQESSVRALCEMNGYNPRYYTAAECEISIMFTGDDKYLGKYGNSTNSNSIELPRFTTAFTNSDGTIQYILKNDGKLSQKRKSEKFDVIEGTAHNLMIGDRDIIVLSDLDDNNRLYIPDIYAAENGIFITNESEDNYWKRVDNLNTANPNEKVYKFGFDSAIGLPYIEFPSDVVNLIDSGIKVTYISCSGAAGNLAANSINSLKNKVVAKLSKPVGSETSIELVTQSEDANLVVSNLSAATNGCDPETINEAYNSFKKTVGTFETLVTCRDYANAIYNLLNNTNNYPYVSNVQVTDRRDDINYCTPVVSYDDYGDVTYYNISDEITPFDLLLYPLNPLKLSYSSEYDAVAYKNTFKPLRDTKYIIDELETSTQNISHTYKTLKPTDIFCYKNKYGLNAKIVTTYKVTKAEEANIIENIYNAIYNNFYSRKVDFGYEIPYDSILEVIENADARIKYVNLLEPEITPYVMLYGNVGEDNGPEHLLDYVYDKENGYTYYLQLLAKNVLAGKCSLFQINPDFKIDLGQSKHTKLSAEESELASITKVTTEANIDYDFNEVDKKQTIELQQNECLQLIAPRLTTIENIYTYGVKLKLYDVDSNKIKSNTEYMLTGREAIELSYENTAGNKIVRTLTGQNSDIVKFNFDIPQEAWSDEGYMIGDNSSEETVEVRAFVRTQLKSTTSCYWIRNNEGNNLFYDSTSIINDKKEEVAREVILGANEYFFYTDSSQSVLAMLGSGTKLTIPSTLFNYDWSISSKGLTLSDISDNGLAAFSSTSWKSIGFNEDRMLTIQEMDILTLLEGDTLIIDNIDDEVTLSNEFNTIPSDANISYILSDSKEEKTLSSYSVNDAAWSIRSRLDINSGPDSPQKLINNHTFKVFYKDKTNDVEKSITITKDSKDTYIVFNRLIQMAGGDNLDMKVTYLDGTTGYDVKVLTYCYESPTIKENDHITREGHNNSYMIECKNLDASFNVMPLASSKYTLFPIYITENEDNINITITTSGAQSDTNYIKLFEELGKTDELIIENASGLYMIELGKDVTSFNITCDSDTTEQVINIGELNSVTGFNEVFKLKDNEGTSLLNLVKDLSGSIPFNYLTKIDNNNLIELDTYRDAQFLWNSNNVANKVTLSEIDLSENSTSISIVRSSKV